MFIPSPPSAIYAPTAYTVAMQIERSATRQDVIERYIILQDTYRKLLVDNAQRKEQIQDLELHIATLNGSLHKIKSKVW